MFQGVPKSMAFGFRQRYIHIDMLIATETRSQEINGMIPNRNKLTAVIGGGETLEGLNPFSGKSIVREGE